MDVKIINSLFNYIETLYYLNKNFLKLCGVHIFYQIGDTETLSLNIISDIPRLIPYSQDKKNKNLIFKDSDGLFEYQNKIVYLRNDYNDILSNNYDLLDKVRKINNKHKHKIHGARLEASYGGSVDSLLVAFNVDAERIEIRAREFIKLIKELNILFSKMIKEIIKYAEDNDKTEYRYYERISRFSFDNFNKIYDSSLLKEIGEVMYDF